MQQHTYIGLLPLISSVPIFALGAIAFLRNRKSTLNILFFLFATAISVWLLGSYGLFVACGSPGSVILWERTIYSAVVFLAAIGFHITSVFCEYQHKQRKIIVAFYAAAFFFFALNWSGYLTQGVFEYRWGCHSVATPLHTAFLAYFFAGCCGLFRNLRRYYISGISRVKKAQALYMFVALFVLAVLGSLAFLPAYKVGIYPVGYFAGILSAIILAYAVFKHHLFDIRVISVEIFSFLVLVVAFANLLIYRTDEEIIFGTMLFVGLLIFSVFLVRSVIKEGEDKEKIKTLAKFLVKTNKELNELSRAKSEFLSVASHQLRTPLSITKGYISLLLEGKYGAINEEQKGVLERINTGNEQLIRLVNELLSASRIEHGKMEYTFLQSNITAMVQSLIVEFSLIAKNKNIVLSFEKPAYSVLAYCDADKLRQVIINLLDNALKYTETGGSVKVRLWQKNEHTVSLSVADSGMGIAADVLPNLFEMFHRGKKTSQMHKDGMGIGLYVARKIVLAHHGNIWAESEGEGGGSAFIVEIPVNFEEHKIKEKKEKAHHD